MLKKLGVFFKWIWKLISWTRILFLNLIFIALVVLIINASTSAPSLKTPDNSALVIAPDGVIVEQLTYSPSLSQALLNPSAAPKEVLLRDITNAIRKASKDKRISGIILEVDDIQGAGISKIEEIGQALDEFKKSEKPVIAYADSMTQNQYMLASYADEVYLNNLGNIYLTGFGVYRNYYKGLADKLGVNFSVFRVGQYKDAVEPFIRETMSDASKQHIGAWLTALWDRYTSILETNRDIDTGTIGKFVNQYDTKLAAYAGDSAKLLLEEKLIDGAVSRFGIREILEAKFGLEKNGDELNAIGMQAYLRNTSLNLNTNKDTIGLIVASGNITEGHQPAGSIGSETLSDLIAMARKDDSLDALVLRVNSGSGSAFASELIRVQLAETQSTGLPVYISMGSVAASGGYWISTPATEIWATPSTLTGSIGVFGLFPEISDSLKKIGVTSDGVETSPIAGATRFDRPLSEQAKTLYQSGVDNIYARFLSLVSESREKSVEEIHEIAQGRVWSGQTAKELGLVDELGSLDDVFTAISEDLELENYKVKTIEPKLSTQEQFVRALLEQTQFITDLVGNASVLEFIAKDSALNIAINTDEIFWLEKQARKGELSVFANCMTCITP